MVRLATALNVGGAAMTTAVSCPAIGQCAAGGFYTDAASQHQAFIVDQVQGVWGTPQEVATILNLGGNASVNAISCPAVNSCVATGFYTDAASQHQAFIVEETDGTWGSTQIVAGALNVGGDAVAMTVSCAAAGSCVIGGRYEDASRAQQAFIAEETGGAWNSGVEVAGGLNLGDSALVTSVSCPGVGACTVAGQYAPHAHTSQAFVMNEYSGTWAKPIEVVGALNLGMDSTVSEVTCAAIGGCAAGGSYETAAHTTQPFVVDESNGHWGQAVTLTSPVKTVTNAQVTAIGCTAAGACTAAGNYSTTSSATFAFVASESNGAWGSEEPVAQSVRSPTGAYLSVTGASAQSVRCPAVGHCQVGGQITIGTTGDQAFVAVEQPSGWGIAQSIAPGQNLGHEAAVLAMSCAAVNACVAAGRFTDGSTHYQAFVASGFTTIAPQLLVTALHGTVPATGTANLVVIGSGFVPTPAVRSNEPGSSIQVITSTPTKLVIRFIARVHLPGRHVLVIFAHGQTPTRVIYVQR